MNTEKLERTYKLLIESKNYSTDSLLKGESKPMINSLSGVNLKIGQICILLSKSPNLYKKCFSDGGMLYDLLNTNHKSEKEYWMGIDDLSSILISDNKDLYTELNKRKRYKLGVEPGGWSGMQYGMMEIAAGDWNGLKKTIEYLKSVKPPYDNLFHDIEIYYNIYNGFLEKDSKKVENSLNSLESKEFRKVRQKRMTIEKDLSIITLALGKLSWMHGMEVEIDSPYVPKELLPFEPLEEYTIPFRFLRDFYRGHEINWRYDPVHPERQDWDNDPENPKLNKNGFFNKLFS